MPKYVVADTPISIESGKIVKPGEIIEMSSQDAKELLAAGLIEVAPAKSTSTAPVTPETGEGGQ